jgi:mercuric ion transport protein
MERVLTGGLVGTIVAGLCCFTPLPVWGLTAVGLGAWVGGIDVVALPALGLSVATVVFALARRLVRAGR